MNVITSEAQSLLGISKCHQSAFPDSLSSKLGFQFLKKMFSWYLYDSRGILFHIEKDGKVIGYCGGVMVLDHTQHGASTSITQYSFNQFILSFLQRPWLLFHPENRKRYGFIWKNLLSKFGFKSKAKPLSIHEREELYPRFGLVVIGVNANSQNQGIGGILLKEFEERAKKENIKILTLSVKDNNLQAINAYKKSGWIEQSKISDALIMIKKI
jgi:ribosomal protein S18 acetylase RimI-like enzyme